MTTRVLALSWYHSDGASSRVRMMQYAPPLAKLGIKLDVEPLLPADYVQSLYGTGRRSVASVAAACVGRIWTLLTQRSADIIWVQREVAPFAPYLLERGLLAGRKVVVDFDDAHHLYYKRSSSRVVRSLWGNKIERLMAMADAVTVGSPAMADVARLAGARAIQVVPSAVDVARYRAELDLRPLPKRFTVGWIGSPMTAEESLPMVRGPLKRFLAETGAECFLIGVKPDQFQDVPAVRMDWTEAGEIGALSKISVGLCPLPDTEWHRGKSGYKIIQYMAAGRPTLASPVGIAAELVQPGNTGFHCRSESDWYERLMDLYRAPDAVAAFGARAQAIASEKFDIPVAASELGRIFTACHRVGPRVGS